jgi:hypothetical protein
MVKGSLMESEGSGAVGMGYGWGKKINKCGVSSRHSLVDLH